MGRMYAERKGNIAVFRGCAFNCCYCAFRRMLKLSNCQKCRDFEPHSHMEVLEKKPPKTKKGQFLTVALSSDISFMDDDEFCKVLDYCSKWGDRTFLIQSKNPGYFLGLEDRIPSNVIIGTTIETNRLVTSNLAKNTCFYNDGSHYFIPVSKAPASNIRYEVMLSLDCRKSVTIEPILDFDVDIMEKYIKDIKPEIVCIGYNSHPEKNEMPEPTLYKVDKFVGILKKSGINVRLKLIREPVQNKRTFGEI